MPTLHDLQEEIDDLRREKREDDRRFDERLHRLEQEAQTIRSEYKGVALALKGESEFRRKGALESIEELQKLHDRLSNIPFDKMLAFFNKYDGAEKVILKAAGGIAAVASLLLFIKKNMDTIQALLGQHAK